jgi:organic hydroperoxide reductase OsmC/OhrA
VYDEDGVLVIRRINVTYRLPVPEDQRATAERVHGVHARGCPVARSLEGGIEIETHLEFA